MMRRLIIISLLLIVSTISYAKKSSTNVDTLNIAISQLKTKTNDIDLSIDGLSKQIDVISYTVETQKDIISQEQSAIENSMSSINTILTIFSILMTLGAFVLGYYINRKEKNMQSLLHKVEEKKKEIFEAEDILSLFRKDESIDILHANNLYTVEMKKLDDQIELAQSEINAIKERMISRKSGIIDITSQNRDKDKLKELAVKVNNGMKSLSFKLRIVIGVPMPPVFALISTVKS